ncbi:MAG: O-antigen ligase family protein [Clostridia bacterium]
MENRVKKIFIIFVILQPLLDAYFLYTDKVINFIGFSPSTIIRFIFVGVVLLYSMYKYRKDKKIIPMLGYLAVSIIYILLHHINVKNFISYDTNNFGYSFLGEAFYIARLVVPMIIIYITTSFKIDFNDLKDVICKTTFIITFTIVITNIFKIGLGSYNNEFIKDNIFSWFTYGYDKYSFLELASKGWFNFANQISGVLIMFLPFIIYEFYTNRKIFSGINLFLIMTSMLMIGTKVALLGTFLVYACMVVIYIINRCLHKSKIDLRAISVISIFLLLYIAVLIKAPATNRSQITNSIMANDSDALKEDENGKKYKMHDVDLLKEKVKKASKEEKIKFIGKFYGFYRIPEMFIKTGYSYKIDPDFWIDIMDKPLSYRLEYRKVEEAMIKRVAEINNNENSKLWGISYCRVQNIFNIERDYLLQYYTIGAIGLVIFILPFALIWLVCSIKILVKYKTLLNTKNMVMCLSTLSIQGVAFYSGNIIDAMLISIYLSFSLGVMINTILTKQTQKIK